MAKAAKEVKKKMTDEEIAEQEQFGYAVCVKRASVLTFQIFGSHEQEYILAILDEIFDEDNEEIAPAVANLERALTLSKSLSSSGDVKDVLEIYAVIFDEDGEEVTQAVEDLLKCKTLLQEAFGRSPEHNSIMHTYDVLFGEDE
jgi:hypothetical protein